MDAEKIANFLEFYTVVYKPDDFLISQLVPDNIMHSVDYEGQRHLIMSKVAWQMLTDDLFKTYRPTADELPEELPKVVTYHGVEVREDEELVAKILPLVKVIE